MNRKDVSNLIGFSADTLRYYERIGVIPPVKRDKNGYRDYRPNDLNWLFLVKCLKDAGLSMEALIDELIQHDVDYVHVTLNNVLTSKPIGSTDRDETYLQMLVKYVDHRIPLISAGSLDTPDQAEEALDEGLDLAAIAHGLIMNPDWAEKVKTGATAAIQQQLQLSQLADMKLPDRLWQMLQDSGDWFDIVK
ncbi:MerR family transcriptional regulator [Lactiplantibacillus brownii]|uniref:MerR family transcriptional regulator n=1 Tax=Lactiplantibacillus brownii TaxID=3069269 RepID=UPI0038994120